MNEKIEKMQEGLRKPQSREKSEPVMISFGSASSMEEEIGRRVKTEIIPKLSELLNSVEMHYNMNTYGDYDKKGAKGREKLLKPLEDLYNSLKTADKAMVQFLQDLAENREAK